VNVGSCEVLTKWLGSASGVLGLVVYSGSRSFEAQIPPTSTIRRLLDGWRSAAWNQMFRSILLLW